jgi:hypothetical protein
VSLARTASNRALTGPRHDPKALRTVRFAVLQGGQDRSLLCVVSLLAIQALRLGNVHERSVEALVQKANSRRDRTVVWAHPSRPVICAIGKGASGLELDKPAGRRQLTDMMAPIGYGAGLLARVKAHDLRRSAAQETAHLVKSTVIGSFTPGVGQALGHSLHPKNAQLSADYIGSSTDILWTKRVEEGFTDPFGIQTTESGLPRKRPVSSLEIDELCQREGRDSTKPPDRQYAARKVRKRQADEWKARELDAEGGSPLAWSSF